MRGVGFEHRGGFAVERGEQRRVGAGHDGVIGDRRGHGHEDPPGTTTKPKPKAHKSVAPQPSSGDQSIPPVGTTVMIVQNSAVGYVLAEASHQVVYTYSKDTKNGKPTCTGACAEAWPPATGMPQAGPADVFPAQFGLVKNASGVEQITYDGMPLYLLKGAAPLATTGNGVGGVWHVVKLSASDIR